jgi:hypothetical protein
MTEKDNIKEIVGTNYRAGGLKKLRGLYETVDPSLYTNSRELEQILNRVTFDQTGAKAEEKW